MEQPKKSWFRFSRGRGRGRGRSKKSAYSQVPAHVDADTEQGRWERAKPHFGTNIHPHLHSVPLATLAFRIIGDTEADSTWAARCTTVLTCSHLTHCEVVLSVSCLRTERCVLCSLSTQRKKGYHNVAFSVTGMKDRDRVFMTVDREYPESCWLFYSHAFEIGPSSALEAGSHGSQGVEVLEFLLRHMAEPFDRAGFYLNRTLLACFPVSLKLGCPWDPSGQYSDYHGGWTCSALCLAALQRTGLLPGQAPKTCTPIHLLNEVQRLSSSWLQIDGAEGPPMDAKAVEALVRHAHQHRIQRLGPKARVFRLTSDDEDEDDDADEFNAGQELLALKRSRTDRSAWGSLKRTFTPPCSHPPGRRLTTTSVSALVVSPSQLACVTAETREEAEEAKSGGPAGPGPGPGPQATVDVPTP